MGKGSAPRPYSVDHKKFSDNWDQIFKKDRKPDLKRARDDEKLLKREEKKS